MWRPFLAALQFLTRVPLRVPEISTDEAGRSLLAYPLVGLLIGGVLSLLAWTLRHADPLLAAALLLAAWAFFTGLLHLDGLADSADAWLGGHGDRERTLAIMKDPRSGPAAVSVLVLVLLVKWSALVALLKADNALPLILAPLLARSALVVLFLTTPYVRPGGLGEAMAQHLPRGPAALVLFVVILGAGWAGLNGLVSLAAAALVFVVLRALMRRRLGGTTGDTAGALVEMTEAGVLVSVALISVP